METVTISPKFQVVIPQSIREAMGLRSGEKSRVFSFRNRIEIIPMRDVRKLCGYLKGSAIRARHFDPRKTERGLPQRSGPMISSVDGASEPPKVAPPLRRCT